MDNILYLACHHQQTPKEKHIMNQMIVQLIHERHQSKVARTSVIRKKKLYKHV